MSEPLDDLVEAATTGVFVFPVAPGADGIDTDDYPILVGEVPPSGGPFA